MERMRLFCIPYAGGSAASYHKWICYLDKNIELYPVELAGRGVRYKTALYETFDMAVRDIYDQIKDKVSDSPYALFGHSMGCWLIYELYYLLQTERKRDPSHLFFSGRRAPHVTLERETVFHQLPFETFKEKIKELGGISEGLISNEELMRFFLPVMRSDFKITETYQYAKREQKLNCGISVFCGKEEGMTTEELLAWKIYSCVSCSIHKFDGDHFFPFKNSENVVKTINSILSSQMP